MNDYILFMHADADRDETPELWERYLSRLREIGAFQGGSTIGSGEVVRKTGAAGPITGHLSGYIRVQAEDISAAKALVAGNPVFECGGSVEIRELPRDG
jgi:hypothetical protein